VFNQVYIRTCLVSSSSRDKSKHHSITISCYFCSLRIGTAFAGSDL